MVAHQGQTLSSMHETIEKGRRNWSLTSIAGSKFRCRIDVRLRIKFRLGVGCFGLGDIFGIWLIGIEFQRQWKCFQSKSYRNSGWD